MRTYKIVIQKSQGVTDESGGWGEIADSLPRHHAETR
jgi:hypothetical protein